MSLPAIAIHGISKQYRIGERGPRYLTLRDAIANAARHVFRSSKLGPARRPEYIWALKDVSFDVPPGEVVGLIGRNGAGKSTLLKILAEITAPTEGEAEIRGRVGSLLEIGTGFHPELTGRENIFLNGAILGMTRAEIRRKFDDIVAFAEIERFIDTPVKWYSSGMHVRLAFAVAAHLEPEILLVDEVLAVGDAQFQKKCMGKMGDVARQEGRTIIFVSHNLAAIQELCTRAVVLGQGRIIFMGDSRSACEAYIRSVSGSEEEAARGIICGAAFEVTGVKMLHPEGRMLAPLEPASIVIPIRFHQPCPDPDVHMFLQTPEGETILGLSSGQLLGWPSGKPTSNYVFRFHIARLPVLPGTYRLALRVRSFEQGFNEMVHLPHLFEVVQANVYGGAILTRQHHGLVVAEARAERECWD